MFPLPSFKAFVARHDLIQAGQKVLLAVSGGKDSVLMVHLFKQAGVDFGIAHCNFNLRAAESDADEDFVKALALSLQVPFHHIRFDTKAYAKPRHLSTQMAARTLRYNWFEEVRKEGQYDCIAVAHHQNDAVETVLLNLTRGTGISGLHGILPKRGKVIRPLLFLSREEINNYIEDNNIAYREDSSNTSDHYARNKIRLHVIPRLQEINTNLPFTFAQNIQRFADTEAALEQLVQRYRATLITETPAGRSIPIDALQELHPQKFLLFEILKPWGFTEPAVDDLLASLNSLTGSSFYSPTHRITIDRKALLITAIEPETKAEVQILPSDHIVHFKNQEIHITQATEVEFERNSAKAYVDLDLLQFPLTLRSWKLGDKFMPLGMITYKKVSDYFINQKVPLPQKARVPILVNGNGDLVWIAGMRQDNRYKVSSTTKKVLIFELKFT
jgi:tRNA(Ile)-lysidine synthase